MHSNLGEGNGILLEMKQYCLGCVTGIFGFSEYTSYIRTVFQPRNRLKINRTNLFAYTPINKDLTLTLKTHPLFPF